MEKLKNAPDKIYLNIGSEYADDFKELTEVTWSPNKVHESDLEYMRAYGAVSKESFEEMVHNEADEYGFQVPYNGTNDFYNKDRLNGFIAGATFANSILGKQQWISVKDRLPPVSESILINGRMGVNVHYYSKGYITLEDFTKSGATHWMPLPEPPKDK